MIFLKMYPKIKHVYLCFHGCPILNHHMAHIIAIYGPTGLNSWSTIQPLPKYSCTISVLVFSCRGSGLKDLFTQPAFTTPALTLVMCQGLRGRPTVETYTVRVHDLPAVSSLFTFYKVWAFLWSLAAFLWSCAAYIWDRSIFGRGQILRATVCK